MKHIGFFFMLFLVIVFLIPLFCPAHLCAEAFPVKTLWAEEYDKNFNHLPAETRVRYPVAFPWEPEPENVKYIFFMTAGQQAICNSTNSNITGGVKGMHTTSGMTRYVGLLPHL